MASPKKGELPKLVDAFAAASFDPCLWQNAMDTAARVTGSVGGVLLPVQGRVPGVPVSPSVAEMISTYFREGWSSQDQRVRGVPMMIRRGVMSDLDFVSAGEVESTPYYQDFLGRFGLRWFAGIKIAAGDDLWCLAIQRSVEQGPLAGRDLAGLGALSNALSSSAELARALGNARGNAALEAFEISGMPLGLFNRYGEVAQINQAAERLLGPDLKIFQRWIVSASSTATLVFERSLFDLLWRSEDSIPNVPVILPRAEGRPILAYPCRLPSVAQDCFTPSQLAVVFIDLETRPVLIEEDIARVFHLTPGEARLSNLLLSEESIERIAENLGIAYETARNTLKRVFQKTGTHRQGELIALLSLFTRGVRTHAHMVRRRPNQF